MKNAWIETLHVIPMLQTGIVGKELTKNRIEFIIQSKSSSHVATLQRPLECA